VRSAYNKAFSLIGLVVLLVTLFSCCEKPNVTDTANTTAETTVIETELSQISGNAVNDLEPYRTLEKDTVDKLEDLFKENKDVFKRTAELMVSQKVDTSAIYDFEEDSIDEIIVFDDGGRGHHVDADDVFSASEQELISKCLKIMASIAPKDTRSISIGRNSGNTGYKLGVDFMFSSKLNVDYGFIFAEIAYSSFRSYIEKDWYTYMYGLV